MIYSQSRVVCALAGLLWFCLSVFPARSTPADAVGGGWLLGGVMGEYYNSTDLSGNRAFSRRDVRIDFDWGTLRKPGGSPSPGYADLENNNYSVRWTGQIMARFSESYIFKVVATNGARLFIAPANSTNWTLLLDAWGNPGTHTVTNALMAGQAYSLKLEYNRLTGPGVCRLLWSSPSTPEEVLDTATLAGLNIATYADRLWANVMDGGRDSWTSNALDGPVTRDTNGWPQQDAYNIPYEGQDASMAAGTYLLQFSGRAQVEANVFGPVTWTVSGTNYSTTLPFGVGYNTVSNQTTATLAVTTANAGILYLHFSQTRRNPTDTQPTGVTNVKLMRPLAAGSTAYEPVGSYFGNALKTALQRYAVVRWILNFDTDIEWTNRVLPSYSTHGDIGTARYWEQMVMLANESGKDLYACLPVRASNAYLTNVANLMRYGSDGVNPYTAEQSNPIYPPLNPNLHVILEHENEVWNWGFNNYGYNLNDLEAAVAANSPDWAVVNFDGAYTSNPDGAWLRWHILRAIRASDIFRSVFGDAAMGSRIRMIYEYQYDDANSTASTALSFADSYFNNADGTNHLATPHPLNYYFWGAGGAVYYASGNSAGTQSDFGFTNANFELPALAAGQALADPTGANWTFTGTAGIYRAAAVANLWTNQALGGLGVATSALAVGCRFTVGTSSVAVYELGRWIAASNSQAHTVHLLDTSMNELASASVNASGAATGAYLYSVLSHPVTLAANTTYYLVSEESAGGDAFYTNAAIAPAAGITINSSVTATYTTSWDLSTYTFTQGLTGALSFGPVNLHYAPVPVGNIGYPPNPPEGVQAAYVQGTGSLSQTIYFPKAGAYALSFQSAGNTSDLNTIRFYYDSTIITANGSSGLAATTNQWYPGNGWGLNAANFTAYSTYVFQVPAPGTHTITIQGLGWGLYDTGVDTNRITYFDEIQVASADALFTGGIPGAGQAFGQVASDDYRAQLYSQARYAQSYGLQVVAYEGGWSLGGDFNSTAFQNWCKFRDPRAATAQLGSLNIFAQSGSRFYVFGTYETWPDFDTVNSGAYPLTQAVDTFNSALPPDPLNGAFVPGTLLPVKSLWLMNAAAGTGLINRTGGWISWNALAPGSGIYGLSANVSTGATVVVEVDGTVSFTNQTGVMVTNFLTKGLHNLKVRSLNGVVTVTNLTLVQVGAPNAPVLHSGDAVGDGFVVLSWTPATNGPAASGYMIRYGTNSGTYTTLVAAGSATNYTLTGLSNGLSFYCVVIATNSAGYSLPSNEQQTTPVAAGQIQALLLWDFLAAGGNAASDGNVASVDATYHAYGVQSATLTRGSGTPAGAMYSGFAGRGAMNLNPSSHWVSTNLAGAKAGNDYFQFTIAPASGQMLSLTSLAYVFYQQNAMAATVVLEYSTNGFATAGVAVDTNSAINSYWTGTTNTVSLARFGDLQNLTGTVTFRLWGYGFGAWQDKGLGGVVGNNADVLVAGAVVSTNALPVTLGFSRSGTSLQLTWPRGTLLEATNLSGPWITNTAVSPFTVTPVVPQKFYRVSVP